MKVLVTGGAGYIGNTVVRELLKRGHQPVVFDALLWGKDSLKGIEEKIKIIEGDCRNSGDLIYALEGMDAVLHLAGIVGEKACADNPKAHFTVNIEATRTLLDCCTDPSLNLIKDFIFASSCSVYGNIHNVYSEVKEDTPVSPLSEYAHGKLKSEEIILERGRNVSDFHPTILRLSTAFGWSERPRLDLIANLLAYRAWKEKKITIYGTGEQYRSLVHVQDIARAFVDVLEAPHSVRSGEIFHVGDKSNNKMIKEIAEIVKEVVPETEIEYLKEQETDKRDYSINCQKIKNAVPWRAQWTVEKGIEDLISKFGELGWDWEADNLRNNRREYR